MRQVVLVVLACLAVACVSASNGPGSRSARSPGRSAQLADGSGRDITMARCLICHSLDYIPMNAPVMDRASWQKTVQKMRVAFGAPITDEEAAQILEYLSEHYSELR